MVIQSKTNNHFFTFHLFRAFKIKFFNDSIESFVSLTIFLALLTLFSAQLRSNQFLLPMKMLSFNAFHLPNKTQAIRYYLIVPSHSSPKKLPFI